MEYSDQDDCKPSAMEVGAGDGESDSVVLSNSADASAPNVATLPAEVWTRILEYIPLSDIMKLTNESTFIRDHVLYSQLRILYIDANVSIRNDVLFPFLTRFSSLQEVILDNLLCNVTYNGTFAMVPIEENDIQCLVLFLSSCKNLRHVFIGKGENEGKRDILQRLWLDGPTSNGTYEYKVPHVVETLHPKTPKTMDVATRYEFLLSEITNGYRHGMISHEVVIHGLPSRHDIRGSFLRQCKSDGCDICRNVCLYFPLNQVVSFRKSAGEYLPQHVGSVSLDTKMTWIIEQQGGREMLVDKQAQIWVDLLGRYNVNHVEDAFQATHSVVTYDTAVLTAMLKFKNCGCDPRLISVGNTNPFGRRYKILRTMFTKLCEIGFQLTTDDFVSILENDDLPALDDDIVEVPGDPPFLLRRVRF